MIYEKVQVNESWVMRRYYYNSQYLFNFGLSKGFAVGDMKRRRNISNNHCPSQLFEVTIIFQITEIANSIFIFSISVATVIETK
jgi:hypothetical protein